MYTTIGSLLVLLILYPVLTTVTSIVMGEVSPKWHLREQEQYIASIIKYPTEFKKVRALVINNFLEEGSRWLIFSFGMWYLNASGLAQSYPDWGLKLVQFGILMVFNLGHVLSHKRYPPEIHFVMATTFGTFLCLVFLQYGFWWTFAVHLGFNLWLEILEVVQRVSRGGHWYFRDT